MVIKGKHKYKNGIAFKGTFAMF